MNIDLYGCNWLLVLMKAPFFQEKAIVVFVACLEILYRAILIFFGTYLGAKIIMGVIGRRNLRLRKKKPTCKVTGWLEFNYLTTVFVDEKTSGMSKMVWSFGIEKERNS
ncbi:hypothetical protein ACJIZ3_021337 [Penstemon smallii]|uniref:Uncharacterized protein n=1 Tax=Penstemon smallii TaxID=265156 RepID=A0ABD3SLA9_9LAMI